MSSVVLRSTGRRRLVGDYSKTSTSTAIDDGGGDDGHTPLYGSGTSQTLISAFSSSSSEDYRSIRPHGFWNEDDGDDDDNAITRGSELATIATSTATATTTLLRGAGTGDAVSDGRVLQAGVGGGSGGKVCIVGGW